MSEQKPEKKNSSTNPKLKKYIRITLILAISPFLLLVLLLALISMGVFGALPNIAELQNPKNNLATVVYSADMKELGKYYTENRVNVKYKDLSPYVVNALIATEDARFHDHSGVDLKALFRSVSGAITFNSSSGGGSTITQQLAKMQFPRDTLNKVEMVIRKMKEWIIASRLEKLYTKEEILTMYLNKFDFLHLAVGIKSSSQIYFSTTPDKLQLHEAAMLVGMAKNPALFNPIRHPERTKKRREVVLKQMLKYGYITQAVYDSVRVLPLGLHFKAEDHNEGPAPYFREYLREHFLKEWCAKHINPETKEPYNVYKDGLKIYTTIDTRMQQYAEEAVLEHMASLQALFFKDCKQKKNAPFAWNVTKEQIEKIMTKAMKQSERYKKLTLANVSESDIKKNFNTPTKMRVFSWKGEIDTTMTPMDSIRYYKTFLQTGFTAIEPQTGFVKAWVGGINHEHFKYDHVRVGARQVGSTFKPFVYALAIQEGKSPCYQVANVKTCITTADGKEWCPDNSDNGDNGKMINLKQALAGSVNYVSAFLMKQYGPKAVIDLTRRMGITADIPESPSICLGTCDISVFEMVAANCTFANQGTYVQPTFVTRIEDRNGKVLEEFVPNTEEVFSQEKAYVVTQLMRGVVEHGTGASLRGSKYKLTNPIAGKTGTTQNNSDGWFMGLTPDLVAGAWVGGEDRSVHFNSTAQGQGARMALPIWGLFFKKVYADKTIKISKGDFIRPAKMSEVEVDCSNYAEDPELIKQLFGEDETDEIDITTPPKKTVVVDDGSDDDDDGTK